MQYLFHSGTARLEEQIQHCTGGVGEDTLHNYLDMPNEAIQIFGQYLFRPQYRLGRSLVGEKQMQREWLAFRNTTASRR